MKVHDERFVQLQKELRDEIWAFLDRFETFKPDRGQRIHFEPINSGESKETCITSVSSECGDVVLYSRGSERLPMSVSVIENVEDLGVVLDILESQEYEAA